MKRRIHAEKMTVEAGKIRIDDDNIGHRTNTDEGSFAKAGKGFAIRVDKEYHGQKEPSVNYPKKGSEFFLGSLPS